MDFEAIIAAFQAFADGMAGLVQTLVETLLGLLGLGAI
jgi:hypothetical protein